MEEEQTRVLIVEDDAFQRLAVVDIFETLEYEVTAKENGQTAWESLNESTRGYNFAVIDMVMPEVDGLELLHRMKQSANPKIKNLPVFIMSSNEEVDMVTACIQMGAIDFMLKPINFALARSLAHKARSFQVSEQDVSEDISIVEFKGLNNYRRVRGLGRGAAGSVDLVEHIVSHQQFALKRIEFQFLTESEQLAAENEVILLRVLIGPTIIRYYDSFTEEGSLYIVMEFAEKNSVDEMVKDYKARGRKFDNEQIYDWIAQTVVALLIMHSKNILHRDLKIQNMFLSHDDVIKLGDFGIAKALSTASDMARTSCGTPYFMAPEVCRGEVYGQKADTWALGCAVYELLTLKKPFDGSNIQQIFDQIQRHNYESLPADVDPHLKLLVSRLLNKLPQHRPSVWELAVDTKIRQHIDKFVIDKNCWEEVSAVLDTADKTNSGNADKKTHDLSVSIPELYKIIRPQIQLEDLSGGWFGKAEMQVFRGDQLLQCIMDLNYNSEQAYNFATELLEQEVMYNIKQGGFKPDAYFRFREDRSDIARNTIHSWTKEVRVVSQVIQDLVIHANGILTAFQGNLGEVKRSVEFDNFLFAIAELQRWDIRHLAKFDKIGILLNLYQLMLFHQTIEIPNIEQGWLKDSTDSFFYSLAGLNLTLKEIKHGILRGNKKPPQNYTKILSGSDAKTSLLSGWVDPRILFVCPDPPFHQNEIIDFNEHVSDLLTERTREYCNRHVCLDRAMGELTLPAIFKDYASDFGKTIEELLKYIWPYFTACKIPIEEVLTDVEGGTILVQYRI